jgi:hypothetical protein
MACLIKATPGQLARREHIVKNSASELRGSRMFSGKGSVSIVWAKASSFSISNLLEARFVQPLKRLAQR